ncbi:hypothetical protein [Adhaeribacter radiodurans]|uniref:XRE family transcriptional regulator n=1 Tax=Adhaeribacter radiodurans TaxID=2745197 RepID=A0A7L7L1V7_9BACT|nr:hypothetical protein [Adhaeribacter radiodurans]QMU26575.1 hypothetical protein HUW48_00445 [Adhaeribacter radiodurans]
MNTETTPNKKFDKAKLLFDQGLINEFKDLFDIAPYSLIAKKLNTSHIRFKAKLEDPTSLKISEVDEVAKLLNIDSLALCALVLKSHPRNKASN